MNAQATRPVPAVVVGASGVLAGELLRLLEDHPGLELAAAVSREPGRPLRELHPQLSSRLKTCDLEGGAALLAGALADGPAALFLGLPHGQSAGAWRALAERVGAPLAGARVVDLSADFRLRDPALYAAAYGAPAPDPEGAEGFVYGLPELDRARVREATRVAAPGCFATAMQLAAVPAAEASLLDAAREWVLFAVTGSSGSGASPKPGTHHPWRHGNLKAYSVGGHRHEAELVQALREAGVEAPVRLVPHSGPFARGIHLTAALPLAAPVDPERARAVYAERFADEPFVEVLEAGVPELRAVVGSNRASLAVEVREGTLIVLVAIDNMIKGGSGQGLQCMNLMLGFDERAGLPRAGKGVC